jgi:hypothetical protein
MKRRVYFTNLPTLGETYCSQLDGGYPELTGGRFFKK